MRLEAWAKDARRQSQDSDARKHRDKGTARDAEACVKSKPSDGDEKIAGIIEKGFSKCLKELRSSKNSEVATSEGTPIQPIPEAKKQSQVSDRKKDTGGGSDSAKVSSPPKQWNVPRSVECFRCGKPGHFQRNRPKDAEKRRPEEDTPRKGSLRGMHLIDKASVYVKMKIGGSVSNGYRLRNHYGSTTLGPEASTSDHSDRTTDLGS